MTLNPNPLLAERELPDFSAILPEHGLPAIAAVLIDYEAQVEGLTSQSQALDFAALVTPLERMEERLGRAFAPLSHLHGVLDSPELRQVHSAALERLTEHRTRLGQNRALFAAIQEVQKGSGFATLDRAQRALVEQRLRGFRLAGVALDEPARSRFREISNHLSALQTGFEEAVLDATDAWSRRVTESELAGLPEQARAMLAQAAREKGGDGWLATLKGPVVQAILTFSEDRALREEVYTAYQTRASDQGPGHGAHDNSARISEILALRHEAACLLGFVSSAELSLAEKMAGSPERVLGFLQVLVNKARPVAESELARLQAFAAQTLGVADLQSWDLAFVSERLRQRDFDFSEQDIKPYFPLPQVLAGLLAIAERVFGVHLVERLDVSTWHPDVQFFDVLDAGGRVRAGVYFDHYARSGKRGGAWMDVCRMPFDDGDAARLPVAFLTCNFARGDDKTPALLTHNDVQTLFHEFGHGLHHMLTDIRWPSVGGISGVEWDAVELPSQFMENFCWQREALDLFARHWQTGQTLPDSLFQKLLAARHFNAGLALLRQLEFALFDFRLHHEFNPAQGARTLDLLQEVRDQVAVLQPPSWQRFPHAFTHIFSGGYAAGYYSYLWAEVLSADAFSAFELAGIFDGETGRRYRQEILAVGGSRPALESFVAFRGREPDPDALLRSRGLLTPAN